MQDQGAWPSKFPKMMLHFKGNILLAKGLPFQAFNSKVGAREQWSQGLYEHCVLLKVVQCLFKTGRKTANAARFSFFIRVIGGVDHGRLAKGKLALHTVQSRGKQSAEGEVRIG